MQVPYCFSRIGIPEEKVLVPRCKTFEAGETHARPKRRHLVVHEACVHAIKILPKGKAMKSRLKGVGVDEFSATI